MKLTDLLTEDLIVPNLKANGAIEAIDAMLKVLVEKGRLQSGDLPRVQEIVHEREKSMSTGIGHGVAIPHGVIPNLDGVVGALAISPDGVEFEAIDHEPVHLVVLVLVGEAAHRQHIRTLAIVSRLMNSAALRQHLLRAETAKEMLRLIQAEEGGETGLMHAL